VTTPQAETPRRPADAATERAVILGRASAFLDTARGAPSYSAALSTFARFVEWLRDRHTEGDRPC
jgi:hypothetical protein